MSDTGAINIRHTDATLGSLRWARERYAANNDDSGGKPMPEIAISLLDQQRTLIEQLQNECLDVGATGADRRELLEQLAMAFNGYSTLRLHGDE